MTKGPLFSKKGLFTQTYYQNFDIIIINKYY
jgi:hypothetical protein